jgi:hypothetical protein
MGKSTLWESAIRWIIYFLNQCYKIEKVNNFNLSYNEEIMLNTILIVHSWNFSLIRKWKRNSWQTSYFTIDYSLSTHFLFSQQKICSNKIAYRHVQNNYQNNNTNTFMTGKLTNLLYPFITFWLECVATTLESHVKRSSVYAF